MDFLQTLSESSQLIFIGSIFILGGVAFRKIRSAMVRYRAYSIRKQTQPEPGSVVNFVDLI